MVLLHAVNFYSMLPLETRTEYRSSEENRERENGKKWKRRSRPRPDC